MSAPEDLRLRALRLYRGPFRYVSGYIWDGRGEMVADDHRLEEVNGAPMSMTALALARVRGWGRISYYPEAEGLQDEVGKLIAEALTKLWISERENLKP